MDFERFYFAFSQGELKFLGVLLVLFFGTTFAKFIHRYTKKTFAKTSLDSHLPPNSRPVSLIMADLASLIVMLLLGLVVSAQLGWTANFAPLSHLTTKVLDFLPNALMASLIFFIGVLSAKIIKALVHRLAFGMAKSHTLAHGVAVVGFVLVITPFAIVALDTLKIDSLSRPAINMLSKVLENLPNIALAVGLLLGTYYVANRLIHPYKARLTTCSINTLAHKYGLPLPLTDVLLYVVMSLVVMFVAIGSASLVGFEQIGALLADVLIFAVRFLFGAVVIGTGFWLSGIFANILMDKEQVALSHLARTLTIGFLLAVGLKVMGIADSIVNLAFGLTLGAVAVGFALAFGLAFGLGGRSVAQRYLGKVYDEWGNKARAMKDDKADL